MSNSWHVVIGFDATLDQDAALDVAGDLAEHGAVASVSRTFDSGTVDLTVEASSALSASERGAALVTQALMRHGAQGVVVTGVEAQTEAALAASLATPVIPEVVGYAEIAQLAGVSRQRARQFAGIAGFPEPAIVTAQGPLMTKASVMEWLRNRHTRRSATPVHA